MPSEVHWNTHITPTAGEYKLEVSYDNSGATVGEQQRPEFERFESLASKLVTVPKSELDAKREKS